MRARAGETFAIVAAVAALACAVVGGLTTGRKIDDWRTWYGELASNVRDDPVAVFLGFDVATWEQLDRMLGRGDRYAVVATGEARFEVRNYAAYRLLPAIQVLRAADADVVVHYRPAARPPACTPVGEDACVVSRGAR